LFFVFIQTFPAIINLLNDKGNANLLVEYTLPKIKTRFKGEHTPLFLSSNQVPLTDTALFDGSKAPERHFGPAKRQEGTLVKSLKQRYLLLQSGMLLVYKTEDDFKNGRSEMDLIPFKSSHVVGDINARGKKAPQFGIFVFDKEDDSNEIFLKFDNEVELQNWKHHLKQNLAYVEYKATHLLF
jgi:hypothetical protein